MKELAFWVFANQSVGVTLQGHIINIKIAN
jgi:hypothetical protein